MTSDKVLNKQIFKKWWFWVIVVVILGLIGFATQDNSPTTDTASNGTDASETSKNVGTLPALGKADYIDKEGLVVFKDLNEKGYNVTAKYVNEAVPATNQEFTEQFTSADVSSCQDRLGFDAYLVSDVTQDGDAVALTLTNRPISNQTCPAGTKDDL